MKAQWVDMYHVATFLSRSIYVLFCFVPLRIYSWIVLLVFAYFRHGCNRQSKIATPSRGNHSSGTTNVSLWTAIVSTDGHHEKSQIMCDDRFVASTYPKWKQGIYLPRKNEKGTRRRRKDEKTGTATMRVGKHAT